MSKQNFITVTLLVSALAFNPLTAAELNANATSSQRQTNSVSTSIASVLHNRGLDEDAAYELSKDLIDNDDMFEAMLSNLLNHYPNIKHEEILEQLSTLALYRQSVDLASYDHLVNLVSKIHSRVLTGHELNQLQAVSKLNQIVTV